MFSAMMGRIKEETVQNVFGYVKAFVDALDRAEAAAQEAGEAGEGQAEVTEEPTPDSKAPLSKSAAKKKARNFKKSGRRAGLKSVSANRTVMGDTGHQAMNSQISYSSDGSTEQAPQGNRAQRRAAKRRG